MMGFSGERSKFIAFHGALHSRATPYATQEIPLDILRRNPPPCWDPTYHFCLNYKPDRATTVEAGGYGLPDPHGFSGSLVWNTKSIECLRAGRDWNPEYAVVTGIVWAGPDSHACLIATKIEYVNDFILEATRSTS